MESRGGWVLITVQVPTCESCFNCSMLLASADPPDGLGGALIPFLCIEPGLAAETLLASLSNSL